MHDTKHNLQRSLQTYKNEISVIKYLSSQLLTMGQLNNSIYELKLNNYASNFNV